MGTFLFYAHQRMCFFIFTFCESMSSSVPFYLYTTATIPFESMPCHSKKRARLRAISAIGGFTAITHIRIERNEPDGGRQSVASCLFLARIERRISAECYFAFSSSAATTSTPRHPALHVRCECSAFVGETGACL